jgi:glutathione S-transferase
MVLKLYGSPQSTCTRRVGTVLREKKVPFELITVDLMKGEHKAPPFLANQPFGQIPYIVRSMRLRRYSAFTDPPM